MAGPKSLDLERLKICREIALGAVKKAGGKNLRYDLQADERYDVHSMNRADSTMVRFTADVEDSAVLLSFSFRDNPPAVYIGKADEQHNQKLFCYYPLELDFGSPSLEDDIAEYITITTKTGLPEEPKLNGKQRFWKAFTRWWR
jgi:hypothetical protein